MINCGKDLVFLDEDKCIANVKEFITKTLPLANGKRPQLEYLLITSAEYMRVWALEHYLTPELTNLTIKRIREYYELSLTTDNIVFEKLLNLNIHHPEVISGIRTSLQAMFQVLWDQGCILLTPYFITSGGAKVKKFIMKGENLIMKEIIDATSNYTQKDGLPYRREMSDRKSCFRLVRTTSWKAWGDVSLEGFWKAIRNGEMPHGKHMGGGTVELLFKLASEKSDTSYSPEDVSLVFNKGSIKIARRADKDIKLDTLEDLASYHDGIVNHVNGIKFSKSSSLKYARERSKVMGVSVASPETLPPKDRLTHFALNKEMDNYLDHLPSYSKNHTTLNYLSYGYYPGLDIDPKVEFPQWCYLIETFLESSKKRKGGIYNRCKNGMSHLSDYLFVYLRYYYQTSEKPLGELPVNVANFKRVFHWEQMVLSKEQKSLAPITLKKFVHKRLVNPHSVLLTFNDFFDFIALNFSEQNTDVPEAPFIKGFVNPVNYEQDVKSQSPKVGKGTDKVAFPVRTIPFILNSFKALESGLHQLQTHLLNHLSAEKMHELRFKHPKFFKLSEYNIECQFVLNGKKTCFDVVPNLFTWGVDKKSNVVPMLSCFRMLRTNLHAGQRMENIQWLDIFGFDVSGKVDGYFQAITIDVDKIFDQRVCQIPTYIYDTLQEEKKIQLEVINSEVNSVPSSHTGVMIQPLFRATGSKKNNPVPDSSYSDMWLELMIFIEEQYNQYAVDSEQHQFTKLVPYFDKQKRPHQWNYGDNSYIDENGVMYEKNATALHLACIHTPHSMRNTYTVTRDEYMTLEEIMDQQGWTEETTKHHYARARHQDDTNKRLEQGEKALMEGSFITSVDKELSHLFLSGENAVRPSNEKSSLKQSINEDSVSSTINDQGLISIMVPEVSAYEGDDGLTLLKSQRSVKNLVLDHCICPAGGDCPKEIVSIVGESHRCGMCPIACYGIDHISGLNARISEKRNDAQVGIKQLQRLIKRNTSFDYQSQIKRQIRLNQLEVSSMRMTVGLLKKKLHEIKPNEYISRRPDMVKDIISISIDTSNDRNRFISNLIEAQAHPEYCSEAYLTQCERFARRIGLHGIEDDTHDVVSVVAGHFSQIMRAKGIGLKELVNQLPTIKTLEDL